MEGLTWHNITLALLGCIIHILIKLSNRQEKDKFCFKYWIRDNWINTLLSVLSTLAILLMIDDIAIFLGTDGTSPLTKLIAFFSGYFNQSFIRAITKKFKQKAEIQD